MKILFFTKNGKLLLVDKTNKKRKKIDSLQHYLDCPVLLERGISFETFFDHVIKEKDFFNKVSIVEKVIANLVYDHRITDVAIEESLQSFRPGFSSAKTLLTLSKFNGIIQYICHKFGMKLHLYNVNTARKLAGIKINRKLDKSTKDQVLDHEKSPEPTDEVENAAVSRAAKISSSKSKEY